MHWIRRDLLSLTWSLSRGLLHIGFSLAYLSSGGLSDIPAVITVLEQFQQVLLPCLPDKGNVYDRRVAALPLPRTLDLSGRGL